MVRKLISPTPMGGTVNTSWARGMWGNDLLGFVGKPRWGLNFFGWVFPRCRLRGELWDLLFNGFAAMKVRFLRLRSQIATLKFVPISGHYKTHTPETPFISSPKIPDCHPSSFNLPCAALSGSHWHGLYLVFPFWQEFHRQLTGFTVIRVRQAIC